MEVVYVTAFRTIVDEVVPILQDFGFYYHVDSSVIPNEDDTSTLFMSSGMQRHRSRFRHPDNGRLSTLQSCIRTDDLDLVGDGRHLTYFEMLGNFSFGNDDYSSSVGLWHKVIWVLRLPDITIHVHPDRDDHRRMWERLGYKIIPDAECVWSDGDIGGHCCEVYSGGLEVGNLVNTLGVSTDVGFGLERLHQVVEQKTNVHETSLFDQSLGPVISDHCRAIDALLLNGIKPGSKGRSFIFRKIVRRVLALDGVKPIRHFDLFAEERDARDKTLYRARRMMKWHADKDDKFWWETCGLLPEERKLLK